MTVHYHGLPLTPAENLSLLDGKNVCVSFATRRKSQTEWAVSSAQSVMWDNGAFSAFNAGVPFDLNGFYEWVAPNIGHPHWAVVPDVIGGSVDEQRKLTATWPWDRSLGAPVWHLHLPLDYLLELADNWPKVCLGSSAEYWQVGSAKWEERMDAAFNYLAMRRAFSPWVHGLRMLSQIGKRWPLSSADSVNVSRNYKSAGKCPGCMSARIDMVQGPHGWAQ